MRHFVDRRRTNLLKTIGWVLDYKGFAVKVTASPEAALEALVKKNYDLVIAQLTTGDRENLDLLKRAKQLNPEVKTMVVSSNNDAIFPGSLSGRSRRLPRAAGEPPGIVAAGEPLPGEPGGYRSPAGAAACGQCRESDLTNPQLRLIFHDIRGTMVAAASSLKLMARGRGEMGQAAKANSKKSPVRSRIRFI